MKEGTTAKFQKSVLESGSSSARRARNSSDLVISPCNESVQKVFSSLPSHKHQDSTIVGTSDFGSIAKRGSSYDADPTPTVSIGGNEVISKDLMTG